MEKSALAYGKLSGTKETIDNNHDFELKLLDGSSDKISFKIQIITSEVTTSENHREKS